MRILLDMDEVLIDFVGGACKAWGVYKELVLHEWKSGVWDIVPPLSRALGLASSMEEETFWSRLNGSEEFWLNLQPLPWAERLLREVRDITEDWYIVSAPSRCARSYSGKVKWLKGYFGTDFDRFVLTPHKHLFAAPGAVLVDDRDSNVESFRKAGGRAVVFPRYHNSFHPWSRDPVGYAVNLLKHYKEACRGTHLQER